MTVVEIRKLLAKYPAIVARVIPSGEDDCWDWTGCLHEGYAALKFPPYQKHTMIHRFVYSLVHGTITSDRPVIRHSCDNRRCINPNHLLAGTILDNVADRTARNRQAKGEACARRKITEQDAREIRRLYVPYKYPLQTLADRFGITRDQVFRIAHGKSWKHLATAKESIS